MRAYSRSWNKLPALLLLTACAAGRPAAAQDPAAPLDMPPAGFGTLRQDQIGIRLTTPTLAIRVIPLDERVIRLLAPDAYRALSEVRNSRATDIATAARQAGQDSAALFMVTIFGIAPEARFSPDELYINSQASFHRPLGIVPLSAQWSEGVVQQRQQSAAIYLFDPNIPILRAFTVSYGSSSSAGWEASLRLLDAERARAISRAQQAGQPAPE